MGIKDHFTHTVELVKLKRKKGEYEVVSRNRVKIRYATTCIFSYQGGRYRMDTGELANGSKITYLDLSTVLAIDLKRISRL